MQHQNKPMIRKFIYILTIAFSCISISSKAQVNHNDSSIFITSLGMHYSYHFAGADLKKTFGNFSAIGTDLTFKLKSQWIFGAGFEYYFSENIKNKDDYFSKIKNSKGYIIDNSGYYAEVFLYQRGYNIQLFGGYQFHKWSPNPNSGPFIQIGAGFMEQWVRIENPMKTAPQVQGEYAKMYDRLFNGFSTTQILGYRYMGKQNLRNFYIGIELTQAWTQNRRTYNADLNEEDLEPQFIFTSALKLGWIIPFYKKAPEQFYYY